MQGALDSPSYYRFEHDPDHRCFAWCRTGNALLIKAGSEPRFISSGSITLFEPNVNWELLLGRGVQTWILSSWISESPSIPDLSISKTTSFLIGEKENAVSLLSEYIYTRIDEISKLPNLMIAFINLLVHEHTLSNDAFTLTRISENNSEAVDLLVQTIKSNSHEPWSLASAAKMAGYSPFHLSRVFRSFLNVGFPEYVDRCRTESAMKRLLATDETISSISSQTGFGTPQAMRNAFREYTGFLPSEIKGRPSE
ncbi:MAG: helix-turn-helix transcriptional regulator [Fimbriimonadaceae bacterium]